MAAAIGVLTAAPASADLRIELRATTVNGTPLAGGQTPHAIPSAQAGDVIAFDVFAVVSVTDQNLSNDRIVAAGGSFRSSPVGAEPVLHGDLVLDVVRTQVDPITGELIAPFGFDAAGFSVGLQQDLDGDGDLDVGSNFPSSPSNYWAARYQAVHVGAPAGVPIGRRIGFGSFLMAASPPNSETLVNFFGRQNISASTIFQDGHHLIQPTFDSPPQFGILISTVPEPTTLCIAGVFARACCTSRRRRRASQG